ncbi:MAG: FkbM family methyltransferase [Isosphaeraceae bacterium]|nr:FkbM family methyltransferase [Isosphaeraceae bacterium]
MERTTVATVAVGEGIGFSVVTGAEADDGISRRLAAGLFPQEYRPTLEILRATAPPLGRVLDLGAHVGTFSLAAAALGYQVAAVEASPRNANLLRESVARNGFDRMRIIEAAIGDRLGTLEFCPYGPYGHVAQAGSNSPTVVVPALTADRLLDDLGWDRPDFIKMDVEGSEVATIRGMARRLVGEDAPPIVYESNGHTLHFFGMTPYDLKSALERLGYRNYLLEPGRLVPVRASDLQPETVIDYLAIKSLPETLRPWEIAAARPDEEIVAQILATCGSPNVPERAYIARMLASSPRTLRRFPEVARAFAALQADPIAEVRQAAVRPSWWNRWLSRSA